MALLIFLTFFLSHLFAETISGKVLKIIDGDTFTIWHETKSIKIRLYGIDSPETLQKYGPESTQALETLITIGDHLQIEKMTIDRYGRWIAKAWTTNNLYINEEMVTLGAAWWYEYYSPKDYDLQKAQQEAQTHNMGLWQNPCPQAPWDFRHTP